MFRYAASQHGIRGGRCAHVTVLIHTVLTVCNMNHHVYTKHCFWAVLTVSTYTSRMWQTKLLHSLQLLISHSSCVMYILPLSDTVPNNIASRVETDRLQYFCHF